MILCVKFAPGFFLYQLQPGRPQSFLPLLYLRFFSPIKRLSPSMLVRLTQIDYDREERSRLALTQGRYAQEHFIEPHREVLERWAAGVEAAFA